jgi:hypothetical protein
VLGAAAGWGLGLCRASSRATNAMTTTTAMTPAMIQSLLFCEAVSLRAHPSVCAGATEGSEGTIRRPD